VVISRGGNLLAKVVCPIVGGAHEVEGEGTDVLIIEGVWRLSYQKIDFI